MSDPTVPAYPIESVDRALTVILAFEETDSLTIVEASRLLGVSRSTAYRLLTVLEHREFVRQDKRTKSFHGGPALLRVGLAAVQRSDIRVALHPLLERVVAEVDETAHLVVLQNGDAFYLDCVEGSKMVRATSRVGSSLPAHVSAAGKVLLANLPLRRLDELLSGELRAVTRRSKVSANSVTRELNKVRKQGWAINDEESEIGLRAVAVLVDAAATGTGIDAAITVAGPSLRLTPERLLEIAAILSTCVVDFADGSP
ncbi:Transcriptional repressor IclR [Baekduia alba]|uniref:IclR family transcriptional regulator n=1 Tax=Baekduia alba TaxID=2997333 RepID=UPI002341F5FE|nr:IclR family transcriptional regulator [Baekduia alba]WCB92097.1 Transcriptional repressor IclR [Baekduia alba]